MMIRRRRCNSRAVLYADLILAEQRTRFLAILMASFCEAGDSSVLALLKAFEVPY